MAVIRSTHSQRLDLRKLEKPMRSHGNGELLAFLIVAVILSFAIGGAYREAKHHPTEFADVKGLLSSGQLILLGPRLDLNLLTPIFQKFGNETDRRLASQALSNFLLAAPNGLSNVGALSNLRIDGASILAANDSDFYARALKLRIESLQKSGETSADPTQLSVSLFPSLSEVKPQFIVRTPEQFSKMFWLWIGAFAAAFLTLHCYWRIRRFESDPFLLPLMALISGMGLALMINLRDPLRDTLSFVSFSGGPIGGCVILLIMSSRRLRELVRRPMRRWTFFWLACALALSTALILFGSGPGESDAKVNLLGFQPIEVIKIFVVLFLASYFAKKWVLLRELRESNKVLPGLARKILPRIQDLFPLAVGMALVLIFLYFQRDLGPALVFTGVFLALFSVALGRVWVATLGASTLALGIYAAYRLQTPTTVYNRVLIWLDPWNNNSRGAEQMAQSLWAFASGGLWGRGFGMGEPALIPAAHTDFVLAGLAEDIGFLGMCVLILAYGLLFWRSLRVTMRSGDDYDFFLGLGFTTLVAFQVLFIACGVLSLVPLSGVVVPFISFGRTSMWVHFAIFGFILLFLGGEARVPLDQTPHQRYFRKEVLKVIGFLSLVGALILGRLFQVMVLHADALAIRPAIVKQADGAKRELYNPRLQRLLREFDKGDILDRYGMPLATSDPARLARFQPAFDQLGIDTKLNCPSEDWRWYPLGNRAFHLIGDARTQANWTAPNSNYIERDYQFELRGFTSWKPAIQGKDSEPNESDPDPHQARIDFAPIVPLLRHGAHSKHPSVEAVRQRIQNVQLTIDARLQYVLAERWDAYMREAKLKDPKLGGGSVVVVDAESGELLSSVSWPMPNLSGRNSNQTPNPYFDRARKGLYPPGSTFKVLGSIQALRQNGVHYDGHFLCQSLGGGRVGFSGTRNGRKVTLRDDSHYRVAHGNMTLENALTVSCNAYFGQMTETLDPAGLLELGNRMNIRLLGGDFHPEQPVTAEQVQKLAHGGNLIQVGIGQGEVLASPMRMSMIAATIANRGQLAPLHYLIGTSSVQLDPSSEVRISNEDPQTILDPASAERIGNAMRNVVLKGTAKRLIPVPLPIAGKTGTAQNPHGGTHAWFIGYTPHGQTEGRRIAFCIMLENGGGGGSAAAPFAATIVAEAQRLGVFSDTPPPESGK